MRRALLKKIPAQVPVTIGIAEPFTATVAVAAYIAALLSLPVILYQAYAYIRRRSAPRSAGSPAG